MSQELYKNHGAVSKNAIKAPEDMLTPGKPPIDEFLASKNTGTGKDFKPAITLFQMWIEVPIISAVSTNKENSSSMQQGFLFSSKTLSRRLELSQVMPKGLASTPNRNPSKPRPDPKEITPALVTYC